MEIDRNISEYDNTHIDQIMDVLNKIPVKNQIEQKDQSELNKMSEEVRSDSTRLRIEETAKRDLEPGIYKTRVELLRIAIHTSSKNEIKDLLKLSSHLYDDILRYLFANSEELWGKDFKRDNEKREDYYQRFIDYVRPKQINNQIKNDIIAIL